MISEYIAYLKDNPQGLWFKRKLYGWGWTPARWQGWVSIAVYCFAVIHLFIKTDSRSHSGSDTLIGMALPFLILTALLVAICYWKGEKPGWQWGRNKQQNDL